MSGIVGDNTGTSSGQIATVSGITTSSSDPAVDTNPSSGLGTVWANTTSGEMYTCTDATDGANVWTNWGDGTGEIAIDIFQGTVRGYAVGGSIGGATNVIQKYSFTSDTVDAEDSGDLAVANSGISNTQNDSSGWMAGGGGSGSTQIQKFDFATGGNASTVSDVGNLLAVKGRHAGSSDPDGGYGYSAGAYPDLTKIERYSFSSDGDATSVGDISVARGGGGASSLTHGYVLGGYSGDNNRIDKYSFASSADGTDIGNLTVARYWGSGTSSTTHGYLCGGDEGTTTIDRVSFASGSQDSVDVGDPTQATSNTGSCGLNF